MLSNLGSVTTKNECNIMVKNAIDVCFGALAYWICGFGFTYGDNTTSNGFAGIGLFFTDSTDETEMGELYARYFFQLSFATTATTIVSGAMAERTNLPAYMLYSLLNFISYVFPAHWVWAKSGFLHKLGVVDIAGCGPVHLVGGSSAVVASIMLGPRYMTLLRGSCKAIFVIIIEFSVTFMTQHHFFTFMANIKSYALTWIHYLTLVQLKRKFKNAHCYCFPLVI